MAVHLDKHPNPASGATLRIGLLNNMPDAALRATERQFTALLRHASDDLNVSLTFFALPGVPRGAVAAAHIAAAYAPLASLWEHQLDALIVTGADPIMPRLEQEPYWLELMQVLGWAREHTASTVWSCLAAHAAVLSMDGIERVRSPEKSFGVFDCQAVADHPLLAGLPSTFRTPHSRWNGLREADLTASGYRVLSRTIDGAVDLFLKQEKSLFVFFQGHPEYQADTLLREFRRDVARFCRGERATLPRLPESYFDPATTDSIDELWHCGAAGPEYLLAESSAILLQAHPLHTWQASAVAIYRNWLHWLTLQKAAELRPFPLPDAAQTWIAAPPSLP